MDAHERIHDDADEPAGRLYFWGERVLYLGPDVVGTLHAHHAVQICVSLSDPIRLRTGPGARWRRYDGVVVASDEPHETDPPIPLVATLWLDPDTPEARRLIPSRTTARVRPIGRSALDWIAPRLRVCWQERWDAPRAAALVADVLHVLAPDERPRPPIDPRLARALDLLRGAPDRRARLAQVASEVSLSASRLAHLLKAEIGIPARRYLLWLRLRDAIREVAQGASMTEAAHAAGFADSAHLSRTCRRMMGFPPSASREVSKFVQAGAAGGR